MVASGKQIKDYTAATTPESDWYLVMQDPNEGTPASATKSVIASNLGKALTVEGTAVLSTSETGGTKFLREDGDGTSSWQTLPTNRNILIDGGFTINQRVYVSAAALASGSYGHDRWKGGSGGGDYSFTQLASPTTITIAANKTLIQVVEDKNVVGGTYTLSWTGTCQARYAINSATPAGAYAASPITITGQTAGTTMSVEFGNGASSGTLGKVQLEAGSVATEFEFRPYAAELALCQRYCPAWKLEDGVTDYLAAGQCISTTQALIILTHQVKTRTKPTGIVVSNVAHFGVIDAGGAQNACVGLAHNQSSRYAILVLATIGAANLVAGNATFLGNNNTSALIYGTGCEL